LDIVVFFRGTDSVSRVSCGLFILESALLRRIILNYYANKKNKLTEWGPKFWWR